MSGIAELQQRLICAPATEAADIWQGWMAEQRSSRGDRQEEDKDLQQEWDQEGETRYPLDTMEEEEVKTDSEKEEWVENKLRRQWTPSPTMGRGARL